MPYKRRSSERMNLEYVAGTQTLIGTTRKNLMDMDTGETIIVDQITKRVYGTRNFWKMYLMDFLTVLGIIDSRQLDVFIYIAENTNQSNNVFMATYKKIAKDVGVSEATIARLMKKLQDNHFIKKIQNGAWMVNPDILMKGNDTKRQILLSYYEAEEPINEISVSRVKKKPYDEGSIISTEEPIEIEESNIIDTGSMPKNEE